MLALAATALWVIFVAELGDKTLFMVLLLASRYSPWRVFVGAALAFLVHGVIAVVLGQLLAGLPRAVVKDSAAVLFLVFGMLLLLRRGDGEEKSKLDGAARAPVWTTFLLIFVAEWGDMTQLLSAAMVAEGSTRLGRVPAALAVFSGAVLGLWLGTALAAIVGSRAGKWLPPRLMQRIAGVCFLAVGCYTLFGAR